MSSDLARRKAELRRIARARTAQPDAAASARVCAALEAISEVAHARSIAAYAALGHEVPIDAFLAGARARGIRLAFARIAAGGAELAWAEPSELVRGALGALEAAEGEPRAEVMEIDAFLIPGLLFDRRGVRLGRGGGHYDRLLRYARRDATYVGICYAERVVDELPREAWDVLMHRIVTDGDTLDLRHRSGSGAS